MSSGKRSRSEKKRTREPIAPLCRDGDENEGVLEGQPPALPIRDCHDLFASPITVECAMRGICVPCAYKLGCFDVALDKEFTRQVPNQRPELCPRSMNQKGREGTLGYTHGLKVLTIGDGDFSFSLAIARMSLGTGLVATSYETRETLCNVYPGVKDTLSELQALGATVYFQVDATDLQKTLVKQQKSCGKFHRIVWNFPCEAVMEGKDGQNEEMELNKDLVRRFVGSARHLLIEKEGQIHINHKTKPPFNQWRIEDVAVETANEDVVAPRVQYFGRVAFDRYLFPPYIPRKALDKKSFPCHDACTYVFGFSCVIGEDPLTQSAVKVSDGKRISASSLVALDADLLLNIRTLMLRSKGKRQKKDNN